MKTLLLPMLHTKILCILHKLQCNTGAMQLMPIKSSLCDTLIRKDTTCSKRVIFKTQEHGTCVAPDNCPAPLAQNSQFFINVVFMKLHGHAQPLRVFRKISVSQELLESWLAVNTASGPPLAEQGEADECKAQGSECRNLRFLSRCEDCLLQWLGYCLPPRRDSMNIYRINLDRLHKY